ncbi:MAG TPA: hypothetical protein VK002_08545 [Rubricoccaceae bacterium]|nr:hypothetical protein [Rubricoccaceae bacterium]
MRRTPAHSLLLLAAFVLGGLVAPSLHQARHAAERAAERAEHVAAGHHHHTAADAHPAEADAPCPEPATPNLHCVLCHGVSLALPAAPAGVLTPARKVRLEADSRARATSAVPGLLSIRGPPEPVA